MPTSTIERITHPFLLSQSCWLWNVAGMWEEFTPEQWGVLPPHKKVLRTHVCYSEVHPTVTPPTKATSITLDPHPQLPIEVWQVISLANEPLKNCIGSDDAQYCADVVEQANVRICAALAPLWAANDAEIARLRQRDASADVLIETQRQSHDYWKQRVERAETELAEARKEIELLIWNLAGCDTIAMGYHKGDDFNKDMARPALHSVAKLASERDQLRAERDAAQRTYKAREAEINDLRAQLAAAQSAIIDADEELARFETTGAEMFRQRHRTAIDAGRQSSSTPEPHSP